MYANDTFKIKIVLAQIVSSGEHRQGFTSYKNSIVLYDVDGVKFGGSDVYF